MQKVFIATSSFSGITKKFKNIAKIRKIKLIKNPLKKKLTNKELLKFAKNCEYIIAGTEVYDKPTIDKLPKLKYLFRLGSGLDNIDINYLQKKNVIINKSKITPEIAVAELIVGYIFTIYRDIIYHNNNLKNKIWKKKMGQILNGKTLGIIGYGKIGRYLYKILKNFGIKILVNDKKKINIKNSSLISLLKHSDIISLNINLNIKKKVLDKKKINLCKKNCIIINTSRPEVIDYHFLYEKLKKKEIFGACLDVFDQEPYYGNLIKLNNVVLTPHIGSYSKEIRSQMEEEALESILKNKIL
jgi:D-3-phosphoglycerate dehydrogenase